MTRWKYDHAERKFPRSEVDQKAWLADEAGQPLCACVMIDVSASGAKLALKNAVEIPDFFLLVLSRDGRVRRPCKVVWRDEKRLGVQFLIQFPDRTEAPQTDTGAEQPAQEPPAPDDDQTPR